jgi:hypothetical protein
MVKRLTDEAAATDLAALVQRPVADLLSQDVPLKQVQYLLGHRLQLPQHIGEYVQHPAGVAVQAVHVLLEQGSPLAARGRAVRLLARDASNSRPMTANVVPTKNFWRALIARWLISGAIAQLRFGCIMPC